MIGDERETKGIDVEETEGGESRDGGGGHGAHRAAMSATPEHRQRESDKRRRYERPERAPRHRPDVESRVVEDQRVRNDELDRVEDQRVRRDHEPLPPGELKIRADD